MNSKKRCTVVKTLESNDKDHRSTKSQSIKVLDFEKIAILFQGKGSVSGLSLE